MAGYTLTHNEWNDQLKKSVCSLIADLEKLEAEAVADMRAHIARNLQVDKDEEKEEWLMEYVEDVLGDSEIVKHLDNGVIVGREIAYTTSYEPGEVGTIGEAINKISDITDALGKSTTDIEFFIGLSE